MPEIRLHYIIAFVLILFCIGSPIAISAQTNDDGMTIQQITDSLYVEEAVNENGPKISPWSINTTLGSSIYYAPGYGAGSNIFAAPHLDFSATNRLTFHGGFVASQFMPLYSSLREDEGSLKSFTNLSMFVAASYRVTSDLLVYGSGVKSMINPGLMAPGNNFSMDDLSFGAAYSFGNFTIGASFHSGNTNRFGISPFNPGGGMYPSPFYR